ncbi:MAG: glutamate racemase [Bacteroidia bacterium]|nr:glutamate racemase [Bacteroidia bacterium]MBP7713962.1 glutamate racemase [Bacteroidia bacterium]MBP8667765.1 glutamate racemase [Bacteroidia bacterium]
MTVNQPIGIFDSGIGGLTVAAAIGRLLPQEQLIYFGDTAHVPYGDKSVELIGSYAERITEFLLHEQKCKAIVIACNTASAAAYSLLRDRYKGSVPVINVIDPMIEAVIADDDIKSVGIIATKTTIASGTYQEKFSRRKPQLLFHPLATPLLASMIEEGFYNDNISSAVLEEYLSYEPFKSIDGLVLACTHYPLIKKEINHFFQSKVKLFDSAEVVASKLKKILEAESLISLERKNTNRFYVSDFTQSFEHSTKIFFGKQVNLELMNLWK